MRRLRLFFGDVLIEPLKLSGSGFFKIKKIPGICIHSKEHSDNQTYNKLATQVPSYPSNNKGGDENKTKQDIHLLFNVMILFDNFFVGKVVMVHV